MDFQKSEGGQALRSKNQPECDQCYSISFPGNSTQLFSTLFTINPETCTTQVSYISGLKRILCMFASCARKESYHGENNSIKS